MSKDAYVDTMDLVYGTAFLGFGAWALLATDSLSTAVGFGLAGVVLGLVSATVLRGRFALSGLGIWFIGIIYGISTADALPGAAYGLLFAAALMFVPRGFRNAKNRRAQTLH